MPNCLSVVSPSNVADPHKADKVLFTGESRDGKVSPSRYSCAQIADKVP
jgi:hypothetical protein